MKAKPKRIATAVLVTVVVLVVVVDILLITQYGQVTAHLDDIQYDLSNTERTTKLEDFQLLENWEWQEVYFEEAIKKLRWGILELTTWALFGMASILLTMRGQRRGYIFSALFLVAFTISEMFGILSSVGAVLSVLRAALIITAMVGIVAYRNLLWPPVT